MAHTDRLIVQRYAEVKRKEDQARKFPPRHVDAQAGTPLVVVKIPHQQLQIAPTATNIPLLGGRSSIVPAFRASYAGFNQPNQVKQYRFGMAGMQS
jgi:hypothetical protein